MNAAHQQGVVTQHGGVQVTLESNMRFRIWELLHDRTFDFKGQNQKFFAQRCCRIECTGEHKINVIKSQHLAFDDTL